MTLDNDTKNELTRESTRIRASLLERMEYELEEWVMDNIAYPNGDDDEDDSLEFLHECVQLLLGDIATEITNSKFRTADGKELTIPE